MGQWFIGLYLGETLTILRTQHRGIQKRCPPHAELILGASCIAAEHAKVEAAGPADCTPSPEYVSSSTIYCDRTSESKPPSSLGNLQTQQEDDMSLDIGQDTGRQCAAVLDGCMDDITPVQIGDTVMKKYKLGQTCEQELSRLELQTDTSEHDERLRQRAVAIVAAVEVLAKLQHKETMVKLQMLVRLDQEQQAQLQVM